MLCYVLYLPLSLWRNNIGVEGAIAVSEVLRKCGNLQHLKWVSATCMCVCLLKMVLVTSYICMGDGNIEEVGQSKLGVAYDGTCTNVMHKKFCSQCTWVLEIVQLRQRKSSKPALKICLVLTKWSGHGHPSPPTSSSPDMYIHTNTNVLKYVRSRLINYYVTSSKWYAAKLAITTVTISISQYCSHVSGNLTSETPSIRDLRECEISPSNMYVYVVMMWHS